MRCHLVRTAVENTTEVGNEEFDFLLAFAPPHTVGMDRFGRSSNAKRVRNVPSLL